MITQTETQSTQDKAWWAYAAFVQSEDLPAKLKADLRLTEVQLLNMASRVTLRPYIYWNPDHQRFELNTTFSSELNTTFSSVVLLGRGIPIIFDDEAPYLSLAEMVRGDLARAIDCMMGGEYDTSYVFCRPDGDNPFPINCYTADELREMILARARRADLWKIAQTAINDYLNLVPKVTYRSKLVVTQDVADALSELIELKQLPATRALALLLAAERYTADKSLLNLILRQVGEDRGVDTYFVVKGALAEIWARK